MRYNPIQSLIGTIETVKLAVSAAHDYRVRTERRNYRLANRSR